MWFFRQPSAANQASRKKLEAVFSAGDDDDAAGAAPKRKLVKLDEEDISKAESEEAEDKKRIIKSLIERIPTAKDELFAYSLDWSIVDQVCSRVTVVSLFVKAAFCFRDPRQDGKLTNSDCWSCKKTAACKCSVAICSRHLPLKSGDS